MTGVKLNDKYYIAIFVTIKQWANEQIMLNRIISV